MQEPTHDLILCSLPEGEGERERERERVYVSGSGGKNNQTLVLTGN